MKTFLLMAVSIAQYLSVVAPALAQCASDDRVYVDPRLVERRARYSEGQMRGILADPTISEQTKMQFLRAYQQQDQPIQMPMNNGFVLISPLNPCIQQFIPLR